MRLVRADTRSPFSAQKESDGIFPRGKLVPFFFLCTGERRRTVLPLIPGRNCLSVDAAMYMYTQKCNLVGSRARYARGRGIRNRVMITT